MIEPPRVLHSAARLLCESWDHPLLGRLQSRVVMSAMTRSFAEPGNEATEAMARYYARRAAHGVGLVLTESTAVQAAGDDFPTAPRIETAAQAAVWPRMPSAVRELGSSASSFIAGAFWHSDYTDGHQVVSSTDQPAAGISRRNNQPYGTPRRLNAAELPGVYEAFCRAAVRALEAGFDGVQLHLAHGYLADRFFDARVSDRKDRYRGSVENRCRFALELTRAVLDECGTGRVMVRISPSRHMNGPYDWPDLDDMLAYLIPRSRPDRPSHARRQLRAPPTTSRPPAG